MGLVGLGGEGGTGGPPRRFIRPSRPGLLFRPPNAMPGMGGERGRVLVPEMVCLLGGIRCSYVLMGFCDSSMRTITIGKLVDEYETGVKNKGGDTNALFLLLLYYLHPG